MARFAGGLLSSSVQLEMLGDILRYVKAAARGDVKVSIYQNCLCIVKGGEGLLGHDHLLALSKAFSYEAHLIVEALHSVLTPAYILRIFVIDELCSTVFADKDPTFVVCNLVRVQRGV